MNELNVIKFLGYINSNFMHDISRKMSNNRVIMIPDIIFECNSSNESIALRQFFYESVFTGWSGFEHKFEWIDAD